MGESHPKPPVNPDSDSSHPQDQATHEDPQPKRDSTLPPYVEPAPEHNYERCKCRPDQTHWAKILLEVAGVAFVAAYSYVAYRQLNTMNKTYCEIQKQTASVGEQAAAAKKALGEIQKQTTLITQQLQGSQAAVVSFNLDVNCSTNSPPRPPEVTVDIENNGHVVAQNATADIRVQVEALPTRKPIGHMRQLVIEPQQMLPNNIADPGGNSPIRREYYLPELNEETCEAMRRLEKTVRVESAFSYDNGFGITYKRSECKLLLATNFSTGDPAKKTEPYPNFFGPVDCVSFAERLADAYRQKRLVDQETKRLSEEYDKKHPSK